MAIFTAADGTDYVDHDPWLTLKQAADIAQVHPATLRRDAARGSLRYARVGGRTLFRVRRSWLDAYLEATSTPIEVVQSRR